MMRVDQEALCASVGAKCLIPKPMSKLGVAQNVRSELRPLNGLRHKEAGDTCGWYIWAGGEPSDNPDFFQPLHVEHLNEWCPEIVKFLGLPPGWRFLKAGDVEDVWFDPSLLSGD